MRHPYDIDLKAGLQKTIRPKSVVRTALRWTTVNAFAERACSRAAGWTRVAYEDFVSAPDPMLREVGKWTGIAYDDVANTVRTSAPIRPGHQMAGSRIRMKPSVVLSCDVAWRAEMPRRMQAQVESVAGRMLRRYGFT